MIANSLCWEYIMTFTLTFKQRLLGLVGFAILTYTLCWFFIANQARHQIINGIELMKKRNIQIEYADIKLSGYPFNISLTINKPQIRANYFPGLRQLVEAATSGESSKKQRPPIHMQHTLYSPQSITMCSDALARKYSIYLPREITSTLQVGDKELVALLNLKNAKLTLEFGHAVVKHGLIEYFGQFASEEWRDIQRLSWKSDSIIMQSSVDRQPIYNAERFLIEMRSYKTKDENTRIEGSYQSTKSQCSDGFNAYVNALMNTEYMHQVKYNAVLYNVLSEILWWPKAGLSNTSFNFITEMNSDSTVELKIQNYRSQDALSSRSMELSAQYKSKHKPIIHLAGYYAARYRSDWYDVALEHNRHIHDLAHFDSSSSDYTEYFQSSYAIPHLHEYEYLMAKFDVEIRETKHKQDKSKVLQPRFFQLRTDRYNITTGGNATLSLKDLNLSGRMQMHISGYPALAQDIARYINRIDTKCVGNQDAHENANVFTTMLQKVAEQHDAHNVKLNIHNIKNKGVMIGKHPLHSLLTEE